VVHCHDLLALRSALGLIAENPTGLTGRIYQRYIRRGFRRARHFISISQRTRADLHQYGGVQALSSEVVYNGLNKAFSPMDAEAADQALHAAGLSPPEGGLLLHVGGGQWYKNAIGVLEMYGAYARRCARPLPLWMLSPPPGPALKAAISAMPPGAQVQFISGLSTAALNAAYCRAGALLFPSLAEGFGLPIAEALACGCPVITTAEAPMTEAGGPVAYYLPRRPTLEGAGPWAEAAGEHLITVLARPEAERQAWRREALAWVRRFDADQIIASHIELYERVLALETRRRPAAVPPVDGALR
jgi:glycosyltransferase involved in cell wall biosynthesis